MPTLQEYEQAIKMLESSPHLTGDEYEKYSDIIERYERSEDDSYGGFEDLGDDYEDEASDCTCGSWTFSKTTGRAIRIGDCCCGRG